MYLQEFCQKAFISKLMYFDKLKEIQSFVAFTHKSDSLKGQKLFIISQKMDFYSFKTNKKFKYYDLWHFLTYAKCPFFEKGEVDRGWGKQEANHFWFYTLKHYALRYVAKALSDLEYYEGFAKNSFTPSVPPEGGKLGMCRIVVGAPLKKRCLSIVTSFYAHNQYIWDTLIP